MRLRSLPILTLMTLLSVVAGPAWTLQPKFQPPGGPTGLHQKEFFRPELYISISHEALPDVIDRLPNRLAWAQFFQRYGSDFYVYIDPRSGTPSNIIGPIPMIPGPGVGNAVTLEDLGKALGRPVSAVDEKVVADLIVKFIRDNRDVLGIDPDQLGTIRAVQVTDYLWQVSITQQVKGVPVRHARIAATINHGNLILFGAEAWGRVAVAPRPRITAFEALRAGFEYVGGQSSEDQLWKEPTLEIVPVAPPEHQVGDAFAGPVGLGYRHRLVWVFGFERPPDSARWEVLVDAHTGEVLAFQDTNLYVKKKIVGGVYPLTSTEVCPSADKCGAMQVGYPMPFANTGLPAPNNFTNSAGLFEYTSGTVTTTLSGKYVRISDACGTISESSTTGDIDLGGTNGQHDCTVPSGHSAGDTAAARSCFYEVNKLAEMARGWLPSNTWLQSQLLANVNINNTCNAFWNGTSINFYRSGGGCRNTGEIAAVFDHEWGHGLDDNDANGTISNSGEAYADIAAIYRLQASCVGYGFFWTSNQGCGQTADGTGYNVNEAQVGSAHCAVDCSGVRDADWAKHADTTPDTPQNFVCPKCSSGTGPCGRQVHCAAAPVRQAAWDLVARDLRGYQGSPFNYDANTAFIIGNKLFYQGSGNVGTWHACSCTNNTSNGCGSTNGYMQWLAADDDNGNINDGTPHMTAIYAAFNRHNIACSTPTPQNSGCSTGPTGAPSLTATPGDNQVSLSWTSVTNAAKYWVFRTEGHAGCNFGKTLIGTVTSTSFTDTEVANGRQYCYVVMAVGSSNACFGPASTCTCVTPSPGSCTLPGTPTLVSPANGATGVSTTPTLDWSDVTGASSYDVQVCSDSACANVVRSQTGLTASQWTVSPALSNATTYYWRARAVNSCGAGSWTATWSFTTVSGSTCTPTGATYDATLKAPKCGASNICGCDTGSLIDSRDNISGKAELNQPNTINNSCADGTSGSYHVDESVDRIVVQTTDGTALGPGKQVRIDATVWCWGTSDYVDIYYTSNASSPTWTAVATGLQCNVSGQAKTFSVTMTLANVSGLHAVRVQERYGGSASACTSGSYNDRDDLIFQVGTTAACTPTGATYDATLKAPKCGASNICGCDTGSLIDSRDNISGKAELNQPNTINNSCADGTSGSYHVDESVDRIVVQTTDGTALGPGKQVRIDATVWCWGTSDYVDIYYASNASSPTWTAVATGLQCNVSGQAKTFSVTMTLANVSGLHAVRVQERYGGSASACTSGSYNDRDDMAFQVP